MKFIKKLSGLVAVVLSLPLAIGCHNSSIRPIQGHERGSESTFLIGTGLSILGSTNNNQEASIVGGIMTRYGATEAGKSQVIINQSPNNNYSNENIQGGNLTEEGLRKLMDDASLQTREFYRKAFPNNPIIESYFLPNKN